VKAYDARVRALAGAVLSDYRLSHAEHEQEVDMLAQMIQGAIEVYVESLEHRRLPS
jgi:hypothetical protein